jgi:hypothetical protein
VLMRVMQFSASCVADAFHVTPVVSQLSYRVTKGSYSRFTPTTSKYFEVDDSVKLICEASTGSTTCRPLLDL